MKTEIEEITVWIDEKGNKVAFKRTKKSESMTKMSMAELKELVCGDACTELWSWLREESHKTEYEVYHAPYFVNEAFRKWEKKNTNNEKVKVIIK